MVSTQVWRRPQVDPGALIEAGFEGDWIPMFNSIAVENIIPPYVELTRYLTIESTGQGGVGVIREALLAAEAELDENAEITVRCYYGEPCVSNRHPST